MPEFIAVVLRCKVERSPGVSPAGGCFDGRRTPSPAQTAWRLAVSVRNRSGPNHSFGMGMGRGT